MLWKKLVQGGPKEYNNKTETTERTMPTTTTTTHIHTHTQQ